MVRSAWGFQHPLACPQVKPGLSRTAPRREARSRRGLDSRDRADGGEKAVTTSAPLSGSNVSPWEFCSPSARPSAEPVRRWTRLNAPPISLLMCNIYSLTKGQAAIRDWFRVRNDRTGNLPLFPGIFPDQMAPIVRVGLDGDRELVMARWARRSSAARRSRTSQCAVVPASGRGWPGKGNRCVPPTSFCEYADTKPRKTRRVEEWASFRLLCYAGASQEGWDRRRPVAFAKREAQQ